MHRLLIILAMRRLLRRRFRMNFEEPSVDEHIFHFRFLIENVAVGHN